MVDDQLVREIDTVKNIVSLGRSARNKVNIKIRQPLSEMLVYVDDSNISKYQNQIIEELNIKKIDLVESPLEIIKYNVKPNFSILGQRFGKDLNYIIKHLKMISADEIIKKINMDGHIKIAEYKLVKDEIEIEEIPLKDYYSISSNQEIKVAINTNINQELREEGMIRDFIRAVQNYRKESDFEVEDRISLLILCKNDFYTALNNNLHYFKGETLCKEIKRVDELIDENKLNIQSLNIEIAVKRL